MDAGYLIYVAREAQLTLLQQRRLHLLAVLVISVSVTILMLFLLVMFNAQRLIQEFGNQAEIVVFLEEDITPDQYREIESTLHQIVGPESIRYVSKDQAWQDFTGWFPEHQQLLEGLDQNPLPASFIVQLSADAPSDITFNTLQERLPRLSGINEVEYGTKWRRGFRTVLNGVQWASIVGGLILGAGIICIMANTTRLTLYTRLHDIEIMQLVGATERLISWPFLVIGMIQGLVGALIGLAFLYAIYHTLLSALAEFLPELISPQSFRFLPWPIAVGTVTGSLILGYLGSAFSLNRMLRMLRVMP